MVSDIQTLTLDLHDKKDVKLAFKQVDENSRFLQMKLTNGGEDVDLTGSSVYIYVKKPDNTVVFAPCEIYDSELGMIIAPITRQMLALVGSIKCEILVVGNGKLSFPIFNLSVEDSIYDEDGVESSNEFSALVTALDQVNTWDSLFEVKYDGLESEYATELTETKVKVDEYKIDVDTKIEQTNAQLSQTNQQVDDLAIKPDSNLSLQRIGRKLVVGESKNTTTYNPDGKACMLQGGCKIDGDTVAYVLWDNLNPNLNKNKLVIMNINTGQVIREKEFNYGWCNSIDFDNGKIYIAERGRTNNDISTNNDVIHVIDYTNLNEINSLNLELNVNAISIHENELYILEEGQNFIHKYDLEGVSKNSNVTLQTNIADLYNQTILVDSNFIYLLSSRPSNFLNVFDFDGNLVKSYNIPTYGGLYFIGEPQFIYSLSNGDMVLGSSVVYFNECVNQFFKFNLKKDINVELPIINYAETVYVNSEIDYYNPDGKIGNEFTSINESGNLNMRNYILNCNNKNYKYTYMTDNKKYIRVINAILTEGLFAQYGHINFNNCTFNASINIEDESSVRLRDLTSVFQDCTFNANGLKYCINSVRNNNLKFVRPVFNNYTVEVVGNAGGGNIIDFNNYDHMPFVNHSNIKKYNLFVNGFVRNYKPGNYSYNTNLSSEEIQKIMDNCYRVKIIYAPFNNSIKVIEFIKNSSQEYAFCDTTMSTLSVNVRFCKTQLKLNNNGYTITSNVTTKFNDNVWEIINSQDSDLEEEFNTIRSIEFIAL